MIVNSNELNTACNFHDVNQWDETITKQMCTRYAPFINAKYNWVIDSFTEEDIKEVSEIWIANGTFWYDKGWYWKNGVYDFQEWLLNKKWIRCTVLETKDDTEALDWHERGYAVLIWIEYNSEYKNDKKDGKVDWEDYSVFKWDIGHFTNTIKWTSRGQFNGTDDWKEMILDSYFIEGSTYEVDTKKLFNSIDLPTKYVIVAK